MRSSLNTSVIPAALALLLTSVAYADESVGSEEMAAKYACVSCHEIDFKKVGPAYEEVARKYRPADSKTIETLIKHVREGSTGVWGTASMPPQVQAPEQDVRALVKWVLSLSAQ